MGFKNTKFNTIVKKVVREKKNKTGRKIEKNYERN